MLFQYVAHGLLVLALACAPMTLAAEPLRILALGDSLTAGYGLAAQDSFPVQLEAALKGEGYEVSVINGGVSGDTTAGGRARLEWALADDPDLVIVALGANDGLRAVDPKVTRENLAAILERLQTEELPVLLAGMYAPPNLGKEYGEEFNAIYPELAERYGAVQYPFFLEGVAADPTLNQADGMHPNPSGVGVIVENILPYLRPLVEGLSKRAD